MLSPFRFSVSEDGTVMTCTAADSSSFFLFSLEHSLPLEDRVKITKLVLPSDFSGIRGSFRDALPNLEEVVLPDDCSCIHYEMFRSCHELKRIRLPDSVAWIGSRAFEFCTSLEEIVLPAGLKSIGDRAFALCPSLKSIDLPEPPPEVWAKVKDLPPDEPYWTPQGDMQCLWIIPDGAFADCRSLKHVHVPVSVRTICRDAFQTGTSTYVDVNPDNAYFQSKNGFLLSKDGTTVYSTCCDDAGVCRLPDGTERAAFGCLDAGDAVELQLPASFTEIKSLRTWGDSLRTIRIDISSEDSMRYNGRYIMFGSGCRCPDETALIADSWDPDWCGDDTQAMLVLGYTRRLETGEEIPEQSEQRLRRFVRRRQKRIWADPANRRGMILGGIITAGYYERFLDDVLLGDDAELKALMLEYPAKWFRHGELERNERRKMSAALGSL